MVHSFIHEHSYTKAASSQCQHHHFHVPTHMVANYSTGHWRKCWVQCLAQRHFGMYSGRARIWTFEAWIIGRPALPPSGGSMPSYVQYMYCMYCMYAIDIQYGLLLAHGIWISISTMLWACPQNFPSLIFVQAVTHQHSAGDQSLLPFDNKVMSDPGYHRLNIWVTQAGCWVDALRYCVALHWEHYISNP